MFLLSGRSPLEEARYTDIKISFKVGPFLYRTVWDNYKINSFSHYYYNKVDTKCKNHATHSDQFHSLKNN